MLRILGLLLGVSLLAMAVPAMADEHDLAEHRESHSDSWYDRTSDSLCVDGDSTSAYDSGRPGPVAVEVDLGADVMLGRVRLTVSSLHVGNLSVFIIGRTSAGVSYTLATYTGQVNDRGVVNIPITLHVAVRYLKVLTQVCPYHVGYFSIQAFAPNGTTSVKNLGTWGALKALYK